MAGRQWQEFDFERMVEENVIKEFTFKMAENR